MSYSKSRGRSRTSMRSVQSTDIPADHPPTNLTDLEVTRQQTPPNEQPQSNGDPRYQLEKASEPRPESTFLPWRIFINHMDSYHGKMLADLLPEQEYTANSVEKEDSEVIGVSDDEVENEEGERRRNKNPRVKGHEDNDIDDDESEEEETNFTGGKLGIPRRKLEVVGTVKDEESKRPEDVAMVIRTTKNKELLLRELMKCGVVIYDITQDDSQIAEAQWALEGIVEELLKSRRDTPKAFERNKNTRYFILISTLMTWALTKPIDPDDPDLPFTEADYRKRKPHPNFKRHIKCEREVSTIAKRNGLTDKLKTVVLGTGLTYGAGEGPLHCLFKKAWKNADNFLPILGSGKNKIPLLYVRDLVEIVCILMKQWPQSRYIVGVEQELVSQATIVKKISKALTTGKVERLTPEEAFLLPELSQRSYDMINANINISPGYIVDNDLHWHWDMPFRDNITAIVEEYKKSRNLYPVKIIVLGPPASGKTRLAQRLAQHYDIHYLHAKNVIEGAIQKLSKEIEAATANVREEDASRVGFEETEEDEEVNEEEDEEDAPGVNELQEQLDEIRDNLAENNGRLDDDILNKLFLKCLLSNDCQNQGYVIDGYPKTLSQAKNLFDLDDNDEDIDEAQNDVSDASIITGNRKIMPELVIVLEANDEFLIERVIRLPEMEIQRTHYNEEGMLRRLKEYRERNTDDETPLQFFDEQEIHPLLIPIEDDICPEMFSTFVRCIERLGEPRNYGPTGAERQDAKKRAEAEALAALRVEAARKEREDFEKKAARERKMMEWTDLLEKLKQEEEERLYLMVEPLRHYLIKYIFPTLTKGLVEVAKLRPEDPIDFLAEYLFKENPEGKMFEPDYTETMSVLMDAIEKLQGTILPSNEMDPGNERYLKMSKKRRHDEHPSNVCRSASNDDNSILTSEENGNENEDQKKGQSTCGHYPTIEYSSGNEAFSDENGTSAYIRDSEEMVASSFSYEQNVVGSRESFGNSTNLSLNDSP